MIAILDTSSLIALVQYFLPFDNNGSLMAFIQQKFTIGEIIVIDEVYDEMKKMRGGKPLEKLLFLEQGQYCTKTDEFFPQKSFFSLLENQFVDTNNRKKLSDVEFELEKENYLKGADCRMILLANKLREEGPIIVTEEQAWGNDGKCFKKIPANCKEWNITTCDLPILLNNHYGFTGETLFSEPIPAK